MKPEGLVDKLIRRNEHLLAKRICEYLKLAFNRVLVHWACVTVHESVEDEEIICRHIVEKLSKCDGISYAEVAHAAFSTGRVRLATKLLDYEPTSGNQVPLLLSMQEDEIALIKAIESRNTDLGKKTD